MKHHFETQIDFLSYYTDWTTTNFNGIRAALKNSNESFREVLQILLHKLMPRPQALGQGGTATSKHSSLCFQGYTEV